MAEITECDDHDWDEFWQNTPQDEPNLVHCAGCEALARMQGGVNRMRVRAEVAQGTYAIPPKEATERELRAYLAADKTEQEDK